MKPGQNQVKFSKDACKQIYQFAKQKVGGFGMWMEGSTKCFHRGEERIEDENMLTPHDKGTRDLSDFNDWATAKKMNYNLVDGFCWLDFYVHDSEELRDNVQVLIDKNGNVVKIWLTWADEKELQSLISSPEHK